MTTVKADIAAADRLLKAAVRKARAEIANNGAVPLGLTLTFYAGYDRGAVVAMLTEAGRSAELLLAGEER